MFAAVLHEYGTPRFDEFPDPRATDGAVAVDVLAAAISQFDLLHASRSHVIKPPILPAVAGNEGVGRLENGRRVYFAGPVAPYGSMAERTLVTLTNTVDVPEGVDDATAAALGNSGLAAWLPLSVRAGLTTGETVLIVGATGIVGRLAVQAARLLGAGRVIAAGRDAGALELVRELGADAVVSLGDSPEDMVSAYRTAAGGPVDVIIDYVWGAPLEAALTVAGAGARIVQVGRAATAEIHLSADLMRAKSLNVLGYATYHVSPEVRASTYQHLARLAAEGKLHVDLDCLPLSAVEQAWARQRNGVRRRLVLLPRVRGNCVR